MERPEWTELDALRTAMVRLLTDHGLDALDAWPQEESVHRSEVAAAVSIRSCRAESGGFWEYLGEFQEEGTGRWRERYGRRLEVAFGLDLYAPGEGGAEACQSAFDQVAQALHTGDTGGLRIKSLSRGEVNYDQSLDVLHCPVEAVCLAYLYAASTEESGVFTDFVVKGATL